MIIATRCRSLVRGVLSVDKKMFKSLRTSNGFAFLQGMRNSKRPLSTPSFPSTFPFKRGLDTRPIMKLEQSTNLPLWDLTV